LHKALEGLLKWVMQFGGTPDRVDARSHIAAAIAEYRQSISASGLTGAVPEEYASQSSVIVEEQACLVEGLY
jgi:hypothetical protein